MTTTAAQNRSAATTYNFKVSIPDIDTIGYFAECRGLKMSVEVYEYRAGGNNDFVHHLPGRVSYPHLELSRGLTNEDALMKWFMDTTVKANLKEVTITLASGKVSRTWTFADAFPISWEGPSATAGAGVAMESLTICHSGLKVP